MHNYLIAKVTGEMAKFVDLQFYLDFSFATGKYHPYEMDANIANSYSQTMQFVVNSLYDNPHSVLKAISSAEKTILIQSDCFLPDNAFMQTLKIAAQSGVEIKIMFSNSVTNKIKYYSSRGIAKELANFNINFYLYDGIMNSNAIVIDDETFILNSADIEYTDMNFGFQNSLFIYDEQICKEVRQKFIENMNNCFVISKNCKLSNKEKFYRAIYPIV